jgi:DNA repair protein RadD
MIYYVQVSDLLRDGYLAPVKYTGVNGFDRSKLKLNSTGADFTDDSVKNYYKRSGFADTLLKMVNYQADRRRNVLVFTRFIEEARHLVERIPGSAIVTGETPAKERAKVTESFRSGQIKVAVNVAVLGIGFDFTALETVVQARPTLSLAVHYQQIGRCIRPHRQKDHALVVDLVGNVGMFGRVEDLKLVDQGGGKWVVESKGRVLTNVYFGEQRGDDPSRHGNGAGEI